VPSQHHNQAECDDALRILDKNGRSQEQRVFQEAEAALDAALLLAGGDQLLCLTPIENRGG
jgi:hypothetical protein